MSNPSSTPQEGLFEGSRCLVGPNWQQWEPATLHRVNEDGTVTIELDSNDSPFMPYWYGVTLHEISFHDSALWPAIFAKISTNSKTFNIGDFSETIALLGF